ncbi:lytic transglycosylase domain-containing protein [Brevundimonas diminuta]|uniref:lytic transglycosylase domain-containing protein n=1 Tax=Brevundimonas diminuta TaxID=293 RepID=UPI003D9A586B
MTGAPAVADAAPAVRDAVVVMSPAVARWTPLIREASRRFGVPEAWIAAYNAGPGRYAEHLATGRPLPGETRAYIAQLARAPATREMPPAVLSGESLFFALVRPEASTSAPPEATASDSLFAVRRPLGDPP